MIRLLCLGIVLTLMSCGATQTLETANRDLVADPINRIDDSCKIKRKYWLENDIWCHVYRCKDNKYCVVVEIDFVPKSVSCAIIE